MGKSLFSISCTTCQARLVVRDLTAIGQILNCPKCASMVLVTVPPGWTPPVAEPEEESPAAAPPPVASVSSAPPASAGPPPLPLPSRVVVGPAADGKAESRPLADTLPDDATEILAEIAAPSSDWPKWVVLAGVPAAIVALGLTLGLAHFFRRPAPAVPPPVEEVVQTPPVVEEPAPPPKAQPVAACADPRWVPTSTKLLVHLSLSQLAAGADLDRLLDPLDSVWQPCLGALLRSMGLKPQAVRRLSWAATDLADLPHSSVVVLELEPQEDARDRATTGEATDLVLDKMPCRVRADSSWPHPFAVIDQHTIITGRRELLQQLAERTAPSLDSKPMARLIKAGGGDSAMAVELDLTAARAAGWPLPTAWSDVWPVGRKAWRLAWEVSEGVGCHLEPGGSLHSQWFFTCESAAAAEKVRTAIDELLAEGRKALAPYVESLPAQLQAEGLNATTADQYLFLLKNTLTALQAARAEASGETVGVRMVWEPGFAPLSTAAVDSRPAIRQGWNKAARAIDEKNQRQLLDGLSGYRKATGNFPDAVAGGGLFSPDSRLSWIATLLPYFGHADWHGRLEFGYSWDSPQNQGISKQTLEAVVNPALGAAATKAGFPLTHYVGVAGVGPDAASFKADDPRAGVFGNGRTARLEDMPRGAANTLALLGSSGRPGPWAAGGDATVRPLTKAPYVNGPDGFGSGQSDGMLAGMADGSVRFVSKDIDPLVLERLAALHGSPDLTVASLEVRPRAKPAPKPEVKETAEVPPPEAPVPAAPPKVPDIDMAVRLAFAISAIDSGQSALGDFLDLVAKLNGGLPITIDPEALLRHGVTLREPAGIELKDTSVGEILQKAVAAHGLVLVVADNQVLVTCPKGEQEELRSLPYTISDLTGHEPAAAVRLANLVRELVAPESWRSAGGTGDITPVGDGWKVEQSEAGHYQVVCFCEKLRLARQIALRSHYERQRFALVTRRERAAEQLAHPVTAAFPKPQLLRRILAALEKAAQVRILVEWDALRSVGVGFDAEATLRADQTPLAAALDELLKPLGLGYRAIDAGLLQITSPKAIAERRELEFYPAADLVTPTGPALVERIKATVAQATWKDAGGSGAVYLDEPSGCLMVLQSQPVQAAVGKLLAELRAEKKKK